MTDAAIAASLPPTLAKFAHAFATPDEAETAAAAMVDEEVPEQRKAKEREMWRRFQMGKARGAQRRRRK
jgi:hypothetical protein